MSQPENQELTSTADNADGLSLDEAFARLSAEPEEPEQGQPDDQPQDEQEHEGTPDETKQEESETETPAEDGEDAETEEEPGEPVFQVKVHGKVLNVTQSELLEGYSREADYRQKTASHAQEKAQFHEAAMAKAQELSTTANRLHSLVNLMAQDLTGDQAELSQLLHTDPLAYVQRKAEFDAKQARVFEAFRAADEFAKAQAEKADEPPTEEFRAQRQEELLNAIPEWRDTKKAEAESAMVAGFLQGHGYTSNELENLYDPRAVAVARKAALYDQLQQAKAKKATPPAQTQAKPVKATAQSGEAPTNQAAKEAYKKLKRSGSIEDALAVLNAQDRS